MPKYIPIPSLPSLTSGCFDMEECRINGTDLKADFAIKEDRTGLLRVHFDEARIIRVLDEMPLSTEAEVTPNEGLIPYQFAYLVEGASFWLSQSAGFKEFFPGLRHYRFITCGGCLDVIASDAPVFSIMSPDTNPA
jgi:hypothetical protein